MKPACSVSGLLLFNPNAKYFNLGLISKEQIEDYAKRKAITTKKAEKYLAKYLSYK